jgi:hypothetical protein
MNNSHDEIKRLIKASRAMLTKPNELKESLEIRKQYGIILEQETTTSGDVTKKINVAKSIEDKIDYDVYQDEEESDESPEDKKQAYRISGGILVLHGKNQVELELTTDEKIAFQETMDEFVNEVSDLVDFNNLNVFPNNVEWSGKLIDYDIDFSYSIGEENGIYINGDMIKADEKFLEMITKLKTYYDKFKSKWAKILASRKKTKKSEE